MTATGSARRTGTSGTAGTASTAELGYPISERVLDNGLRVIASPDHAGGSVAVNLWYDVGSRHEEPGRTGFAHLFEHLMFQGSANVASAEHFGLLQPAGASVNATTWFDRTNYFEALPAGGLDLALWLEADRMGTLLDALSQENFENQREVVKEEKRQRYDNVPYGDVIELIIGQVFPDGHPYSHTVIGSMDDLNAAGVEDARNFFRRFYMPNNAVLSIVGDVDAETAFAKAEQYFGTVPAATRPEKLITEPLPPLTGLPRLETTADVPAEAVYLTWRLPADRAPGYDALELAFGVLGQGQSARLTKNLVRGREIAESAFASAMGLVGGNSLGMVGGRTRSGVTPEELEAALIEQIDGLITEPPTAAELERAKAQFERHWMHELARIDSRADQLSGFATLYDDPTLINTRFAEIEAVTPEQVSAAISDWFTADRRATLIYRQES
ncbi:M16 family metallopeptidase [Microlunatus soli]|uniref:Predicted Zn-dependent peptidase n=1 Tax=Microlunatus soli TaxID=630515 RepID=A0A1H1MNZ5_9ACTN|nr:pitrilysin family protein [Microlunatus soli]SDR87639.1 Predicted Zn-dependent peptidase [Microlunatus soli]